MIKTEADQVNRILKNTKIALLLKYLGNIWRYLEMPLITCKIELKLKWTNHCVFSETNADNFNANLNTIIFTIKDTKLYVLVATLLAKVSQNLSELVSRGFQ